MAVGNGWGNGWGRDKSEPAGTSRYELHLDGTDTGIEQQVVGLLPASPHQASAWLKVSDPGHSVTLTLKGYGGDKSRAKRSAERRDLMPSS